VMTRKFSAIRTGAKVSEAIEILSHRKISELPVVNDLDQPIGLIDITDVIGIAESAVGRGEVGECMEEGAEGRVVVGQPHLRIFGATL